MPEGVLPAKIKSPLLVMLNGPVVTGVTAVFEFVIGSPCKVSLFATLRTIFGVFAVETVIGPSFTAFIGLATVIVTVAESQFTGLAPDSHT